MRKTGKSLDVAQFFLMNCLAIDEKPGRIHRPEPFRSSAYTKELVWYTFLTAMPDYTN
jgi:hypothetical protein